MVDLSPLVGATSIVVPGMIVGWMHEESPRFTSGLIWGTIISSLFTDGELLYDFPISPEWLNMVPHAILLCVGWYGGKKLHAWMKGGSDD